MTTNDKFVFDRGKKKNKFPFKWPSPPPPATRTNRFLYGSSFYTIELRIDVVVKEAFQSVREHVMGKITVCLFFFFFFTEYKISHVEHVARRND